MSTHGVFFDVRAWRERLGLSQDQAAEQLGMSKRAFEALDRDETKKGTDLRTRLACRAIEEGWCDYTHRSQKLKESCAMSQITLSANRGNEETWRIDRLGKVAAKIAAKSFPIVALHDHKGTLYVNWSKRPETQELLAVMGFWSDETECLANHYLFGQPICIDVYGDNPFGPAVLER